MATTEIPINGEATPSPMTTGPPQHCKRKMKRVCCCLTFLLILNLLLTLHISHSICKMMHFFYDNDMILMPGGEQSFCNDFCVDLCINNADGFNCEITSCLNNCNLHFGNSQMTYSQEIPPQQEPQPDGVDIVIQDDEPVTPDTPPAP
eukprot:58077_1